MLPRLVPPLSAATQDQKPGANRQCGDTGHHQVDQKVRLRSVDGTASATASPAMGLKMPVLVNRSGRLVAHAGPTPSTSEHKRAGTKDLSGEHGHVIGDAALLNWLPIFVISSAGRAATRLEFMMPQCTVRGGWSVVSILGKMVGDPRHFTFVVSPRMMRFKRFTKFVMRQKHGPRNMRSEEFLNENQ